MRKSKKLSNLLTLLPFILTGVLSFSLGVISTLQYNTVPAHEGSAVEAQPIEPGYVTADSPFWQDPSIQGQVVAHDFLKIDQETSPVLTEATPDLILSNFQNRVSSDFKIPDLIFNQTKFWFRVYTEFDSNKKIIHDSLHPHIIYDVIDITEILNLPARAQWLNVQKAEKEVARKVSEIRNKLKKMSQKNPDQFDDEELYWWEQLKTVKGSRKKIIHTASLSVRVQTGQKNFFENGLKLSGQYLDGMEEIFKNHKLPVELTRLPFVESSFVIGATSKVGAAGIWQFMPGIGRKFLKVTDEIDERRNPWKSTVAAAKLLKENHMILHRNWGLALTAYNHGPSGVRQAMKVTGSKDIAKIVRTYRSKNFDFASSNFYTCFLAALYAYTYKDMIWSDTMIHAPLAYEKVKIKKTVKVRELVAKAQVSDEEFLSYNPELDRAMKRNLSVPRGYEIFLPVSVAQSFSESIASLID
jgi:membrane-bound lytic murein transglycosylase D